MRRVAAFVVVAGLAACQGDQATVSEVGPGTYEVTTPSGVSLEVIDWGGSGRTLVFLGGAGATAHSFDGFAPQLTDEFRVLGITRRGAGGSADVVPDSFGDLLRDVVDVLDAFELGAVVLVGHSFAGFEITRFAERYPDRCLGLVYLDAAYDYAARDVGRVYQEFPPPEAPPMTASDSASVEGIQGWYERTQGFPMSASEIAATGRFDSSGRYLGRVQPTETARRVMGLEKPAVDLSELGCPGLGLFPVPGPLRLWHPSYDLWETEDREKADRWQEAYVTWVEETRDSFARYPRNEVVEYPNTGHAFFLQRPDEVSAAIRTFVQGLD